MCSNSNTLLELLSHSHVLENHLKTSFRTLTYKFPLFILTLIPYYLPLELFIVFPSPLTLLTDIQQQQLHVQQQQHPPGATFTFSFDKELANEFFSNFNIMITPFNLYISFCSILY